MNLHRWPHTEGIQVNCTKMLQKTHTGHMGIEKCRQRARQVMYWPGMNQSIEEIVKSCSECLKIRPKQTVEP